MNILKQRLLLRGPWLAGSLALIILSPSVNAAWQNFTNTGPAPSPRRGVRGILDPAQKRIIYHGAETADFQFLADTWYFDLTTRQWQWPSLAPPTARCHHTFVVDAARGRGLVFAGFPRNNELWAYDLTGNFWTEITPAANNPLGRCLHVAVLCAARNEMIIYGGLNGGFAPDLSDTWSLNLTNDTWTRLQAVSPPGRRYGSVMVLDAPRDRLLLFGGLALTTNNLMTEVNDLWALDLATRVWTEVTPSSPRPSPRQFAKGVNVPGSAGMVLFGGVGSPPPGSTETIFKNDLWFLSYADLRWTRLEVEGPRPPARFRHTLVLEEPANVLWLSFGQGPEGHFADLWRLDLQSVALTTGAVALAIADAGAQVELSWEARPITRVGQATNLIWPDYAVQQSSDLTRWQSVQVVAAAVGAGNPARHHVRFDKSGPATWYRVQVLSPPP